jgi:hypothetical protein
LPRILINFQEERYPPRIEILIERGTYGLSRMAEEDCGHQPDHERFTGKCQPRLDVRKYLVQAGDSQQLRPLPFYDHL